MSNPREDLLWCQPAMAPSKNDEICGRISILEQGEKPHYHGEFLLSPYYKVLGFLGKAVFSINVHIAAVWNGNWLTTNFQMVLSWLWLSIRTSGALDQGGTELNKGLRERLNPPHILWWRPCCVMWTKGEKSNFLSIFFLFLSSPLPFFPSTIVLMNQKWVQQLKTLKPF